MNTQMLMRYAIDKVENHFDELEKLRFYAAIAEYWGDKIDIYRETKKEME